MSYTHLSDKLVRKTRKQHTCSWCGKYILKGSSAFYSVGVFEGDFSSLYLHCECWHAMKHYFSLSDVYAEEGYPTWSMQRGRPWRNNCREIYKPPVSQDVLSRLDLEREDGMPKPVTIICPMCEGTGKGYMQLTGGQLHNFCIMCDAAGTITGLLKD